jgi:hypothetical protein
MGLALQAELRSLRRSIGGPSAAAAGCDAPAPGHAHSGSGSGCCWPPGPRPVTYLWSAHLLPPPPDWGPNVRVVGFAPRPATNVRAAAERLLPPALESFLAQGASVPLCGEWSICHM